MIVEVCRKDQGRLGGGDVLILELDIWDRLHPGEGDHHDAGWRQCQTSEAEFAEIVHRPWRWKIESDEHELSGPRNEIASKHGEWQWHRLPDGPCHDVPDSRAEGSAARCL